METQTETPIEEGTGGQAAEVVVSLEEKPAVGTEGTVGHQPTQAELKAYAKSILADEYDLTPKGRSPQDCWPGTDIPKSECPEYDDMAPGEQAAVRFTWNQSKKLMQATASHTSQMTAPMRKAAAIALISEGLDDAARAVLPRLVKEMEDESGQPFAPDSLTENQKKLWQRAARGAAVEGPQKTTVGKEPKVEEGKVDLTSDEREYIKLAKEKYGVTYTPEQVRKITSEGFNTSGYVMSEGIG